MHGLRNEIVKISHEYVECNLCGVVHRDLDEGSI